MSWFYDALKRVEEENPTAFGEGGSSILVDDGASFLSSLQSIADIGPPPSKAETRVKVLEAKDDVVNTGNERPEAVEQSKQTDGFEPNAFSPTGNGYRSIRVPVREDSRLVFHTDQHGLAAEQYRLLRRTLMQDFSKPSVLMITSPGEGDGKSLTALNLASCLADSGEPTLLVELDVRRPSLNKLLGCEIDAPGIEDALSGKVSPHEAVCYLEEFSLHITVVIQTPRDPSHLVNSKGVREFLRGARERFRWIIIDAPPTVPAADVSDLLSLTDGVLMVIRAQYTPKDLTKRAFELLGRRLHSIIFNGATIHSNPHYRYLSHYYHSPK